MLGVNQSDFMSYMSALKTNYRKGIHRMEAILANPTHAAEFAANLGGVSVVLGVPVGLPDRNSDKLLELLLGSDVADDAVLTWMHQFYEFTDWDDLLSDSARCKEMANNPLIWRAAGGSKLAVGKSIATLAGLSCADYADIDAVAASQVAMAAVAASQVAMTAVIGNATALNAVVTSSVAMTAIQKSQTALNAIAASSMATAKYAAGAAGLNPADYADMTAIAASQVAMAAVAASQVAMTAIVKSPVAMAAMWRSDTAIKALQANATAWKTFTGATSAVMGKTVAILANLDPSGYADMTAIAASQVAMAAVAASQVAMAAVAASNTATKAIAASQTALNAIAGSTTALDALYAKKSRLTGASASKSGKFIILQISNDSVFNTSKYGYATLSDGSQPSWENYKGKYAFFMQYKKIATYIKNDTEDDDWIDYFPCG
ncbi:hypothetical protein [Agathobaculum sp.]|uniref:hypothetical protein n=1 Tax=Agathobaculum sp. TaxID=2048138 RepID=UPI003AB869B2